MRPGLVRYFWVATATLVDRQKYFEKSIRDQRESPKASFPLIAICDEWKRALS
jgi:hypothetical protein